MLIEPRQSTTYTHYIGRHSNELTNQRWPTPQHERESFRAFLSHLRLLSMLTYFVIKIIVRSFRSFLVIRQEIELNAFEYLQLPRQRHKFAVAEPALNCHCFDYKM